MDVSVSEERAMLRSIGDVTYSHLIRRSFAFDKQHLENASTVSGLQFRSNIASFTYRLVAYGYAFPYQGPRVHTAPHQRSHPSHHPRFIAFLHPHDSTSRLEDDATVQRIVQIGCWPTSPL